MDSQQFLSLLQNDFDEKVFVSKVFETKNLVEPLKMVSDRLSELDASIYQHVSKHNSELLSQTVDLENFSNIVGSVESRIRSVSNDVNRIKQRLSKPYEFLSNQVTQIRRMGLLCDVLRHVLRISTTTKKLLASSNDLVQASECINELEYTFKSMDWKGITVLEEHHETMVKEKDRVTKQAWQLIHSSFDVGDQARLGLGLLVFDNLGILPKVIQALVSDWQTEIEGAVKSAVDVDDIAKRAKNKVISSLTSNAPGRAAIPNSGGQAAAFRSLLWTALDQMVTTLDRCMSQARLLKVTLRKKRPSAGSILASTTLANRLCTHVVDNWNKPEEGDGCIAIMMILTPEDGHADVDPLFTSVTSLPGGGQFLESYSDGLLGWAATCMGAIIEPALRRRSGQLREALEGEYPRLLKLFLNLSKQQIAPAIQRLLNPFETAYLARSLTRLFDRVNSTFVGVTTADTEVPRITDAERIIQAVATELAHAAAVHDDLFCKIAKNIAKVVTLFATKVEGLVATGPEASQVDAESSPTAAQLANTHLVNFTCAFAERLRLAVARHAASQQRKQESTSSQLISAQAIVDQALTSRLSTVCLAALEPLLNAIAGHISDNLLPRMHTEQAANENAQESAYVKDLQNFVAHVRKEYLVGFTSSASSAGGRIRSLNQQLFTSSEAALRSGLQTSVLPRCLDALAVNLSLVRPCATEAQRSRLTTDSVEIEMTITTLASTTSSTTSDAFARLRGMRQLLAVPTEDVLSTYTGQNPPHVNNNAAGLVGAQLPGSLILHHMICRSPEEIPSPYQTASGWTLDRYTRWCLTTSNEPTRLAFIGKALGIYVEQVEARQQRRYPQNFPVIRDLLEYYTKG